MPTLTKVLTVTVTPEQFLENCSDNELKELDLLIQSPRYASRINEKKEIGFNVRVFCSVVPIRKVLSAQLSKTLVNCCFIK